MSSIVLCLLLSCFTFHLGSINVFHCPLFVAFLFHLSPRLCPSTVGCSPPSVSSIVLCLLFSCSLVPFFLVMSFCHLLLGRPLDLFPLLGCHSVQPLVHLLSFILAICPAHLHFSFSVYSIVSIIFVLFQISEHGILSRIGYCSLKKITLSPHFI